MFRRPSRRARTAPRGNRGSWRRRPLYDGGVAEPSPQRPSRRDAVVRRLLAHKQLSSRTAEGRRQDWFPALLDQTRQIHRSPRWTSPGHALRSLAAQYRPDRTEGQEELVVIGGEKATLLAQLGSCSSPATAVSPSTPVPGSRRRGVGRGLRWAMVACGMLLHQLRERPAPRTARPEHRSGDTSRGHCGDPWAESHNRSAITRGLSTAARSGASGGIASHVARP